MAARTTRPGTEAQKTRKTRSAQSPRSPDEIVDEASEESMAASDPPAFTPVTSTRSDPAAVGGVDAELDEATKQRILHRAYEIWETQGRPHGQDLEHWLMAKLEILADRGTPG